MTDVQIAEFVNDRIITDRIQKGHLCLVYIIQWLGLFFAACRLPFDRNIFCQVKEPKRFIPPPQKGGGMNLLSLLQSVPLPKSGEDE